MSAPADAAQKERTAKKRKLEEELAAIKAEECRELMKLGAEYDRYFALSANECMNEIEKARAHAKQILRIYEAVFNDDGSVFCACWPYTFCKECQCELF